MKALLAFVMFFGLTACASGEAALVDNRHGGSRGVTQAGPQDIAYFRSLVEAGQVPGPEILDQIGFFAEHALTQPAADCGASVCAHPSLAVAPRFDSGTWTMAFVSLNSPVDPATRPREPVHVVLAVERSTAAQGALGTGQALDAFVAALTPEDRVSLVTFGDGARVELEGAVPLQSPNLGSLLYAPWYGSVDLYAGIAAASDALAALPDFVGSRRVVLLTSGASSGGIGDAGRIEALASGIVRQGTSFSVVGMGTDYQPVLPERIADLGAGTYSFAEDSADLTNVLTEEATLQLLPLATDVELRVTPSEGYSVGRVYGVTRATVEDGVAVLRVPALFLGARTGPKDTGMGRRGGGGGLFVELLTDPDAPPLPAGESAFRFSATYVDADSGEDVALDQAVMNDLRPGQRPSENWPHFSAPDYGKAFMMLNMYLALRTTLDLYAGGDCGAAMGVAQMMEPGIMEWQRRLPDPDIDADTLLLYELRDNIRQHCKSQPVPPSNVPASCFAS